MPSRIHAENHGRHAKAVFQNGMIERTYRSRTPGDPPRVARTRSWACTKRTSLNAGTRTTAMFRRNCSRIRPSGAPVARTRARRRVHSSPQRRGWATRGRKKRQCRSPTSSVRERAVYVVPTQTMLGRPTYGYRLRCAA
ncbi:hypothetical protein CERSUDRAFT_118947 [Gelatoporia subvermispora B]|uniref:Uncharacterized protein n=1 Tax=Ceriporiopsis subvermispora (strain B) TaxID=914234 RepID=M2P9U8_CERS8|nr:hypothetical protein CERSUDRAFT_118947 [Gelatoporia subvermispora B]